MSRGIGNLPAGGASVELYVMLEAPAGPITQGKDLTYEIGYRSRVRVFSLDKFLVIEH